MRTAAAYSLTKPTQLLPFMPSLDRKLYVELAHLRRCPNASFVDGQIRHFSVQRTGKVKLALPIRKRLSAGSVLLPRMLFPPNSIIRLANQGEAGTKYRREWAGL
jgi:hypothetical protein